MTCTYIRTAAQRNRPERVLPFNHNLLSHGGGVR